MRTRVYDGLSPQGKFKSFGMEILLECISQYTSGEFSSVDFVILILFPRYFPLYGNIQLLQKIKSILLPINVHTISIQLIFK